MNIKDRLRLIAQSPRKSPELQQLFLDAAGEIERLEHAQTGVRNSASSLMCWWAMVQAQEEMLDEPIPDDAVILSFMGSGASTMVLAKDLRAIDTAIAQQDKEE